MPQALGPDRAPTANCAKILCQLVEAIDSSRELSPAIISEELDTDIPSVLLALITCVEFVLREGAPSDDKESNDQEMVLKMLHTSETIVGIPDRSVPSEVRIDCLKW